MAGIKEVTSHYELLSDWEEISYETNLHQAIAPLAKEKNNKNNLPLHLLAILCVCVFYTVSSKLYVSSKPPKSYLFMFA